MHSAIPYYHPAVQSVLSVRQQLSPHNLKVYWKVIPRQFHQQKQAR